VAGAGLDHRGRLTQAALIPTGRQREAIEAPPGPVLVLAGPGAGKTFCLIERVRWLVQTHHFDPARICAVTFTNKAAGEIASRLAGALGPAADLVTRSTIHALCVRILREHGEAIGLPRGFGIADEEYQRQVLRRAGFRKDVAWPLTHFGRHRLQGMVLDDWLLQLYQRYREILDRRQLLDFDDLVLKTEVLLRTRSDVAEQVAGQWDYLLVDEFQDLNQTQYAILHRLAAGHRNFFAVGDDEQSIYAWAGADRSLLSKFMNDFGLRKKEIVLETNQRCSRQIFDAARRLVEHNPPLFDKDLRATRESPWPVELHRFADDAEEVAWLIADLRRDREQEGHPWGEVALLYRRHDIGDRLEAELVQAGIPCQLAQGRALADDPVVQYLLAALRVIQTPDDPLLAEQFARGVLPRTLFATLRADADRKGRDFVERLRQVGKSTPNRDEDGRKVRRCLTVLANLPAMADRHPTLGGLVEELLSQRVGEYRTILEEHADEIGDPAELPAVRELAEQLGGVRHGRATVWLSRRGGAEIGLAGMLRQAGVTMVEYLDPPATPRGGDLVLEPAVTPLELYKALQLVWSREQRSGFADFVAVDTETTDRDIERCELVELAAVRVRGGQLVEEFRTLVRPDRPVTAGATAVHGYRDADLAGAPSFAEAWSRFRAFAGADVLVAHNGHGFDFPILRRLARGHSAGNEFPAYDTLPLARSLHPGSGKLQDLAVRFQLEAGRAHHALDDTRLLARVFLRLEQEKLARARKTGLVNLLEYLAVALALSDPAGLNDEARMLLGLGRLYALGRYSQALAFYEGERHFAGAPALPDQEELIRRLGGRELMDRLRREKGADDRYPAAMARLRRLLDTVTGGDLREQLAVFLERVALSQSRAGPEVDRERVNLLTLHSTKGLEFSRVYVIGVEDAQLPGAGAGREPSVHEIEEGRRLLYVGMTRAKDRLVLTRAGVRGGADTGGTRYLAEIGLEETVSIPR